MFCMKCGKELKDGEVCECQRVDAGNHEQSQVTEDVKNVDSNETNSNQQQNVAKNKGFVNFIKNFGMIFVKPVDAIRDAVKNSRWVNALIYVLIFSAVVSIFTATSTIFQSLKYYNSAISSAKERYNEAVEDYGENSFSAKLYKRTLDNARENRVEYLTDGDLILKTLGNFAKTFVLQILGFFFITAVLFIMGKILRGKGGFLQLLAGMGLIYNIQYLSQIVLPLIDYIPFVGTIAVITSAVTIVYGILMFFVVRETFEIDDNKATISVFTALALVTFFFTVASNVISKIIDIIDSL